MAKTYKETKVDVRPVEASAVVDIQIPTQENAQRQVRLSLSSVTAHDDNISIKDDEDFAKRYLATQGSVYFRQRRIYPRTFLWRVVNEDKVLEIQSTDVSKSALDHNEANLVLRLDFQEAILPSGVALADTAEHDVLNVFVLTSSKRLYTLAIRPEFFRRVSSIDANIQEWCKSFSPSPLSFTQPHRLHACSPKELFLALDNGALLRLTRRTGDDGETKIFPSPCPLLLENSFLAYMSFHNRIALGADYLRRKNLGSVNPRSSAMDGATTHIL
jgi:nuclear pore complex protein Nup160